jgi:hypothetical protein
MLRTLPFHVTHTSPEPFLAPAPNSVFALRNPTPQDYVGIGFVFASYSDIRVFSGNNEYSYSLVRVSMYYVHLHTTAYERRTTGSTYVRIYVGTMYNPYVVRT